MKNKKGYVLTTTFIIILIIIGVIVIIPFLASGGLAVSALGKIPAPIWIIIGIVLLFKLAKKK